MAQAYRKTGFSRPFAADFLSDTHCCLGFNGHEFTNVQRTVAVGGLFNLTSAEEEFERRRCSRK